MSTPGQTPSLPAFFSQQVTAARRFYLDLKPRPTRDLTVICGGWEVCAADYSIDRATFPYLSVEFVVAGSGELVLAGKRHSLQPGTVFTYGPEIAHSILTSPERRLEKYFVDFAGERARKILGEFRLAPGSVVTLGTSTDLRQAFDTLIRVAGNNDRLSQRAAALQLELLLVVIDRAARIGSSSERPSLAAFERCKQYLEGQFLEVRTIEDAAKACHLNVSYLSRLFRRFQGEPPFRYLQRLQMQWAADRLDASDRLIREVADELGVDPFQFSRTFKRVHGVSPSAFLRTRGRKGSQSLAH